MKEEIDREKMVCPCCGKVFRSDKGGLRYCPFCIRHCDGDGCYAGKETVLRGQIYILREGALPAHTIYTRCEDPLFARAELLVTMEGVLKQIPEGKAIWGVYDIDQTFGVEDILKDYRHKDLFGLLDKIRLLRQNGWKYRRHERKD